MILFFPQWQGAGQGNRIDIPARVLMDALRPSLRSTVVFDVPVETSEALAAEGGIWGRGVVLRQLSALHDRLTAENPERVFTIGGDCGIEVVPVSHLNRRHENFALVWLDGHADLNTPESSPSATFHGMPLRVLMGEGDPEFTALVHKPLTPQQVVMAGGRDLDPAEDEFIRRHSIVNLAVGTPDVAGQMVSELAARGVKNVYIHLDLDALDPAEFPYMHYPAPHGFSVRDVAGIIHVLDEAFEIVGMCITEYDSIDGKGLDILAPLLGVFTRLAVREG